MARPKWQQELEIFSKIHNLFVLTDNIHDTYPVYEENKIVDTRECLEDYVKEQMKNDGYQNIVGFDPARGFYDLLGDMKSIIERSERALAKVMQKGASDDEDIRYYHFESEEEVGRCIYTLLTQRIAPVGIILRYSGRMITRPDDLDEKERKQFLYLRLGSEQEVVLDNEQEKPLRNIVCLLTDKLNDLPAWFYLDNPALKAIAIPHPDFYARAEIIDYLSESIPNSESLSVDRKNVLKEQFVGMTDGMCMKDIGKTILLMIEQKIPYEQIEKAIWLYRHGVKENPWEMMDHKVINDLEDELNRHIVGQDKAIRRASDIIKRAVLGMTGLQQSRSSMRPRGVLFLAGPTGTGKTQLAKEITKSLFKDERNMIRFDMSEYRAEHSDQRLLGSPPGYVGYEEGGQLTNAVKEHPFAVLLFDEIEKAHPSILDKFLQILDDGRLTDSHGETVYFQNCLIVFTSNLGISQPVRNIDGTVEWNTVVEYKEETPYEEVEEKVLGGIRKYYREKIARPELLSRIGDNIIVFDFIRPESMNRIMRMQVEQICAALRESRDLEIELAETAFADLDLYCRRDLIKGEGGRGVGNTVERFLINPLASYLFSHEVGKDKKLIIKSLKEDNDVITVEAEETERTDEIVNQG